jgi:hypothetical protein
VTFCKAHRASRVMAARSNRHAVAVIAPWEIPRGLLAVRTKPKGGSQEHKRLHSLWPMGVSLDRRSEGVFSGRATAIPPTGDPHEHDRMPNDL